MGVIQSSINSMLGSISRSVLAVKGYQTLKAKQEAAAQKKTAAANKAKAKELAKQQQVAAPVAASIQDQAAARAKQSAADAVNAKMNQRRNFMDYLKNQPSSLGPVGELSPDVQKKIAKQYSPNMRRRLMDAVDKEARSGKHL